MIIQKTLEELRAEYPAATDDERVFWGNDQWTEAEKVEFERLKKPFKLNRIVSAFTR